MLAKLGHLEHQEFDELSENTAALNHESWRQFGKVHVLRATSTRERGTAVASDFKEKATEMSWSCYLMK